MDLDLTPSKLHARYTTPFKQEDLERKSTEIVFGKGIPTKYKLKSPWQHPNHADPRLNELLDFSIRVQSGKSVGVAECEDYVVTNCAVSTTGLMFGYLRHLGIDSRIVTGDLNNNPELYQAWLEIDGVRIDTAYTADQKVYSKNVFERKSLWKFDKIVYEDDTDAFEKEAAFIVMTVDVQPNVAMYDLIMRKKLKEMTGRDVLSVRDKWEKRCWHCGAPEKEEKMLKCGGKGGCGAARYCDRNCQAKDWKEGHKKLHKGKKVALERKENEAGAKVMREYWRRRKILESRGEFRLLF